MKEQKNRQTKNRILAIGLLSVCCTTGATAQTAAAATLCILDAKTPLFEQRFQAPEKWPVSAYSGKNSVLLMPRWTAECLPFFCRIEHRIGKKADLAFKFRLGSVEYVDWLEGK